MRSVGIKTLKNKLSEYVRLVRSGETVLVTDRDQVVAELGPPRAGRNSLMQDPRLAELVRKGWLKPASLPRGTVPPRAPIMPFVELMRELAADREDR